MKEDLALTNGEKTSLDGLNVLGLGSFTGNICASNTK